MQTIKTHIKTYIKKVKLINPLTLFKNWFLADIKQTFAELNNSLDDRVDKLERVNSLDDIERRLEDLEYYDLYDIQERAENAERKTEDNDNYIESINERSETNQESIKILKDKLDEFHTNYKKMTDDLGKSLLSDFKIVFERLETLESETSTKKTRKIVAELLADEGLSLNKLDKRVYNLEELAKIQEIEAERNQREEEIKRSEASLSAIQKLTFEICKYYGGDFNLDDFNNCYDIIKKYDVKEVK